MLNNIFRNLAVASLLIGVTITQANLRAQTEEFRFKQLTTTDGLTANGINDILQDSQGFIWFATDIGLHRWDGYTMKIFSNNPKDTNSLSSSAISTIYEDSDSILWVGTYSHGLNRFNRNHENFIRYDIGNANPDAHKQNIIFKMFEDNNHNFWIGTQYGLLNLNRTTGEFERFILDSKLFSQEVSERAINDIRAICNKNDNTLLVGTASGLAEFDVRKKVFIESPFNELKLYNHKHNHLVHIYDIYKESSGAFWLATFQHGLYRYEPSKNLVENYLQELSDPANSNDPTVTSISANSSGDMWLGTLYGLYKYDRSNNKFNVFLHSSRDETTISSSIISKVYVDNDKNLWIGTRNGGVSLLPHWQKPYIAYDWDSEDPNSLAYGQVTGIYEDKRGGIWISSSGGGLSHYDPKRIMFTRYYSGENESISLISNIINVIHGDDDDNIWIGFGDLIVLDSKKGSVRSINYDLGEGRTRSVAVICEGTNGELWIGFKYSGFARYNIENDSFRYFFHDPDDPLSLSNDIVTCLYQDNSGKLWIGTMEGLNRLDNPRSEQPEFKHYKNDTSNPSGVLQNTIEDIYQDSKGRIWVGAENGMNIFDFKMNRLKRVNIIEGSTNNMIKKILEDNHGNLWIRWGEKLVKYNPDTGNIRVYDERDGFLPASVPGRWDEVLYIGKSGIMYYGGVNRFVSFDPDKLVDNPNPPKIVFTNFLLNNKPVTIGEYSPLKKSITETEIIELSHDENILSFEFAALDYTNPIKNKYAYKMEDVDDDWIYTDASRRFANYTNLDPGEYKFSVKASNCDGIWNEEGTSISIVIFSPWWSTTWAYIIYLIIVMSIIYFTWKLQLKRIRIKQDYEMSRFEAKKLHEIDEMKSTFFANISHEFRTPLTLILGPVKEFIIKEEDAKKKEELSIVYKSANRLNGLVNQLLDLSKLEAGKMTLQTCVEDIIPLLKGLVLSFASLAERKKIKLNFSSASDELLVYVDRDKIEKIINNVLSNAFKFTTENGTINVNVGTTAGNADIKISDSGIGISQERQANIFDRFYQVDGSHTREQEGSGIGLALTKELVELHKGKIEVKSEEGKGTTFTIKLQLGKAHLKPEEISKEKEEREKIISSVADIISEDEMSEEKLNIELYTETEKPLVLIVEDNNDVRNYIRGYLDKEYRLLESKDGEDGLSKALEHIPDLIASDVMMPKMDGFQLCTKIKTDERTSHIPVILLTAKASVQDKIEGLETGADDYILKPFDAKELQVRIKNLIEQRKRVIDHFKKQEIFEISNLQITSRDKKFISKAIEIINQNISNENFDVNYFAQEIGLSRVQLHRKLTAITGHSSSDLIRIIRLTKAAELIQSNFGNISEIGYEVGFSSPAYFAKTFRLHFGVSPSEYRKDSHT